MTTKMADLELERDIPPGLAKDDRRVSPAASVEKQDMIPVDDDVDSVHEGLEFPSEEELVTLRRVSDALPWTAYSERHFAFLYSSSPTFFHSDCCRRVG